MFIKKKNTKRKIITFSVQTKSEKPQNSFDPKSTVSPARGAWGGGGGSERETYSQ